MSQKSVRHLPAQPREMLVKARYDRGWSQQQVADLLTTTALNISRWERGLTTPNPYFRHKLCALFEASEAELGLRGSNFQEQQSSTILQEQRDASAIPFFDPLIPIPTHMHYFVGRDKLLAQVKAQLFSARNVALFALNGLPGVGKTTLALHLVYDQEVREHFTGGILWTGIGPNPDIQSTFSYWGTLLGIHESEAKNLTSPEAWAARLRATIGTRRFLLVLDDVWQLETALTYQIGGPHCGYLLTTRIPQIALAFAPLNAITVDELDEEQGMNLLRYLAREAVEHEYEQARLLVHMVGGLPLALTLMGNYLRIQSYNGQPRRIRAALQLLLDRTKRIQLTQQQALTGATGSDVNSVSLQAAIGLSEQDLSQHARKVFLALSVLPAKPTSFSEEVVLAISQGNVEDIDELSDAGLLESVGSDHYTLHQTIMDYVRMFQIEREPLKRMVDFSVAYIEHHRTDYALLEKENLFLLHVLNCMYDANFYTELMKSVTLLTPFLQARGLYSVAETHLQHAKVAALELHDRPGQTRVLFLLGEIAQKRGQYKEAEAYYQESLALAQEDDNTEQICALLTNLGWVFGKYSKYTQAEHFLQEGLKIARQFNYQKHLCNILGLLGSEATIRGDFPQAETYLQEGLTLSHSLNDHDQQCIILMSLGICYGMHDNFAEADEYLQLALVQARQLNHRELICQIDTNLAATLLGLKDFIQAKPYVVEGLMIAQQIGHRELESHLLSTSGYIATLENDFESAEVYLQAGLNLARQIGKPMAVHMNMKDLGELYLRQQKSDAAFALYGELLASATDTSPEYTATAQFGLAKTAASQGKHAEALTWAETSYALFTRIGQHNDAEEVHQWLTAQR